MKNKPKILIVDSDSMLRDTLSDILKAKGYEVFTAKNGTSGLREISKGFINLVIVDLNLPDIPGNELLNRIGTDVPRTEIIVLTGRASLESVIETTNKGAFSYLQKPYEIEQLLLHVQRAIDKQQTESGLRLFRNLINQSNDAIFVIDPETSRFQDVNDKACSSLGYTREELLDMGVIDIEAVIPDSFSWKEHVKHVQEQGYMLLEGKHKRKDGSVFPVEINVKYITEEQKGYMIAVARDITDRKRAERKLEERDKNICGLKQLIDFSILMREEMQEGELIKHMAQVLKAYFHLDVLAVLMMDTERDMLEVPLIDPQMPTEALIKDDVILDPTSCRAIRTGQEFIVKDIEKDPACECLVCRIEKGGYSCFPLIAGGATVGAVLMIKEEKGFWDSKERHSLLSAYIDLAASAIYRVRLLSDTRHASITDDLTGVYNRRFFDEMLNKHLALATRHREPLGILVIDMDYFKDLNDTYGHTAGDKVLQQVSAVLRDSIRTSDILCRYGRDDFVVIMPTTCLTDLIDKAEKIRRRVESFTFDDVVAGKHILKKMTVSIGIASFPEHGADYDTLVNAADNSMYKAKSGGRDRVEAP